MASRSLGTLTIDLVAKTGMFEQGMDRAARNADKRMRDIQRKAKMFGIAVGASLGAVVVGGITAVVRNTMQAEQALAQLDAILKSTGEAAGYTREQLVSMASQLQSRSTFGSNEIIEAQTRLLSYSGILGENIPRAMQSVMDQATRLNISLSQSAETIGRALESPSKAAAALAQQGFGAAFTKEVRATIDALVAAGREADAQIMILEILEESYGGAAEAARGTFGGALKALRHTINDVMTGGSGDLVGLTQAVNDLNDALNDPGFRQGASWIKKSFFDMASDAARYIDPLTRELKGVGTVIEGMGVQAQAAGIQIAGMFKLSMDEIRRGQALMDQGGDMIGRGLRAALGPATRNPFGNVVSSVRSTYDQPRTADTSGLDISGKDKKKGLSDEEKAANRLQSAYESLMGSMHQRIALFGKESEEARVRYEIEHGSLKGVADALAEQAIQRAKQIDHMRQAHEAVQELARKEEEKTKAVEDGLKVGAQLLRDLQFENALMSKGNAARATAIQLYGMTAEAVAQYGEAIAQANRDIEASLDQIELMDGMRHEFADFFSDVVSGTKSVGDAFRDMLDNINRMIMQRISENWVEQLFGAMGTNQGGSAGGNWFSALAGLFGGGKAGGGVAAPWRMYEVNERGMEMATVGGRDYLLTGSKPVEITPSHRLGMGGSNVTNNFALAAPTSPKTQTQMAARVGYELRRSQRFGT